MLIYIDRTALFIICIHFFYYYYCYLFLVCVVHYMCLCCSIDLVSICANKEIYNNNNIDKNCKKCYFLTKQYTSQALWHCPSSINIIYWTWNCSSESTLWFTLCQIKIRLLERHQKCWRQGSSATSRLLPLLTR